jgi:hypothetical protein
MSKDVGICQSIYSSIMCFITLGLIAIGLLIFYTKGSPTQFLVMQDPPGINATSRWNTNTNTNANTTGNGTGTGHYYLQVELYNSLDDKYTTYFDTYVDKWDNGGVPDVLQLSTQRLSPDSSCKPYTGKVNVCNDNFGKTDWRGITALVTENEFVVHALYTPTLHE